MAEVVDPELHFEPVRGARPIHGHEARVVDEQVEAVEAQRAGVAVDITLDSPAAGTPIARAATALAALLDAARAAGMVTDADTVDDLAMLLAQLPTTRAAVLGTSTSSWPG